MGQTRRCLSPTTSRTLGSMSSTRGGATTIQTNDLHMLHYKDGFASSLFLDLLWHTIEKYRLQDSYD